MINAVCMKAVFLQPPVPIPVVILLPHW